MLFSINGKTERILALSTKEKQLAKAEEELQELSDALVGGNVDEIAEEVADVYIMLTQIADIYNLTNRYLDAIINYKLERTIHRMERGDE